MDRMDLMDTSNEKFASRLKLFYLTPNCKLDR